MFNRLLSRVFIAAVIGGCLLVLNSTAPAQTTQLPITDFLNANNAGAYQIWTDPSSSPENWLSFDMYGKRATAYGLSLGTTIKGKVTVQSLPDGMRQVTVNIHTKNAVCWGTTNGLAIPVFGFHPSLVAGGATASLGDGMSKIVYAPRPISEPLYGGPTDSYSATIMCDGTLRAGSGYPEGTEGFAQTTQVGLYNTGVPAGCPPEQDGNCFPAEKVQFKPTGN